MVSGFLYNRALCLFGLLHCLNYTVVIAKEVSADDLCPNPVNSGSSGAPKCVLKAGRFFEEGTSIRNGKCRLHMQQSGNLVLLRDVDDKGEGKVAWSTFTQPPGRLRQSTLYVTKLTRGGNLITTETFNGGVIWASHTEGGDVEDGATPELLLNDGSVGFCSLSIYRDDNDPDVWTMPRMHFRCGNLMHPGEMFHYPNPYQNNHETTTFHTLKLTHRGSVVIFEGLDLADQSPEKIVYEVDVRTPNGLFILKAKSDGRLALMSRNQSVDQMIPYWFVKDSDLNAVHGYEITLSSDGLGFVATHNGCAHEAYSA